MSRKVILIIMDGWGIGNLSDESAVYKAKTPFYNKILKKYPNSKLIASENDVGLPKGQMGNSEVGHMNIGAGRVVDQDLIKLNKALENGGIKNKSDFIDAVNYSKDNKKAFHIMGLFSKGGVHSHSNHLYNILEYLKKSEIKNIYLHLFTDGRDCSPNEGHNDLSELLRFINNSNISLASLSGRYYSMDRDNRWERIKLSYDAMVHGNGVMSENVLSTIKESYSKGITDEFIKPIVCINSKGTPKGLIGDGDVLFSFNYRSDRMRQISKVLTQEDNEKFKMGRLSLIYLTMTNYQKEFKNINVLFDKENIKNTLGEVLSDNSKKQLRIAETEKYPHVTFFFSGGREKEFNLERRILCKSPNVATYDLKPEMSAKELSLNFIREIEKESFDFACLNFANPDMVGHTGDFDAAVKACEVVDIEVSKIVDSAKKMGYTILITADHGNAEIMINADGSPHTYHTTNLVPFILISENRNFKLQDGKLGDIAPTILDLMNIPPPLEMTGVSLVK
mgnify:CR=1 FL=1